MNEDVETLNDDTSDAPQVIEVGYDYSEELKEIISLQRDTITELRHQNEILLETNNGLSLVVGYQYMFLGTALISIVCVILWRVLSKWYFRGC